MFINLDENNTLLARMFKNEIKKYAKTFSSSDILVSTISDDDIKGDVIYPIDTSLKSVTDLLTNYSYCQSTLESISPINYESLFNAVTSKILTLSGEFTFTEAINQILIFIEKAGLNFYGALLRKGNTIINPFNIASVLNHISNFKDSPTKFKIMLYFYPDRTSLDLSYKTELANKELIDSNIENILKSRASKVEIKSRVLDVNIYNNTIEVITGEFVKASANNSFTVDKENYIVAHQAITRGVVAPYYGASALTKTSTGSASGFHISPFLCANISYSSPQSLTAPITYTSVCTGSEPKNTLKGLTSLTQCNMLSPYNRNLLVPGALAYADACIAKSLEIYFKAGITSKIPSILSSLESKIESLKTIYATKGIIGLQEYFEETADIIEAIKLTQNFIKTHITGISDENDTTNIATNAN